MKNFKIILPILFYFVQFSLGSTNLNSRIVIVGGGVSGLAAFNELQNYGFKNITLLEAENRLGGRIYSIPFNNSVLEIGAQWIHGQVGNPVFNLMDSRSEIDYQTTFFRDATVHHATQDGKFIDETFADYIRYSTDDFFERIYNKIQNIDPYSQSSIGSYIDPLYQSFLVQLNNRYPSFDKVLVSSMVHSVVQDQKVDYAVDSFYDLTAAGVNEGVKFSGNKFTNLKNGYSKLIDILKANISSNSIKLNQLVTYIDWSNSTEVLINVFDINRRNNIKYAADLVLITLPLGVLKQNYKAMFVPSLPLPKAKAIEKLGFGSLNKIFIVYEKPLFKGDDTGFQLYWRPDLSANLPIADQKCNLANNRFYKSFSSFTILPKFKNVLFGFLVGEDSVKSEGVSDECFIDVVSEMMTKFYPKLNLTRPSKIIRSKWSSNPNSRGSYSYIKVGSYPDDVEALASSVNDRLFFSGEATDARFIGTTQGALITGITTAKNIAKVLDNF